MSGYFGQVAIRRNELQMRAIVSFGVVFMLACAGAGIWILQKKPQEVSQKTSPENQIQGLIEVLVPALDIEPNQKLEPHMFRKELRPEAYTSPKILKATEAIKGQFAKTYMAAGEPVHAVYVSPVKASGPISPTIPDDFLAVTIRVDDISSVDGMVRPGETVDVSWVHQWAGKRTLDVIVRGARVIGADRDVKGEWRPGMAAPGTVTLLLQTEDAQRVQLAQETGKLILALRGLGIVKGQASQPLTEEGIVRRGTLPEEPKACAEKVKVCSEKMCEQYCFTSNGLERIHN